MAKGVVGSAKNSTAEYGDANVLGMANWDRRGHINRATFSSMSTLKRHIFVHPSFLTLMRLIFL